jgi:predicted flap endonuclease-1-like 5' DNA nuclease
MTIMTLGPSGGLGGHYFSDYTLPPGTQLKAVHVFAERYVDAVQFVYSDAAGNQGELPQIGGLGGKHFAFILDDDEYLTGISGLYDWYIDCIQFHTNKRVSERYGEPNAGQEFHYTAPDGYEIFGLFGRANWYVDALGVLAREAQGITAVTEAPAKAPATTAGRSPKPKDLAKVEGIGPKIANLLIENDILDLADLSQTSVDRLRDILKAAGSRYSLADPSTWPQQAALGAKGEWDKLTALQQKLDKGRRS